MVRIIASRAKRRNVLAERKEKTEEPFSPISERDPFVGTDSLSPINCICNWNCSSSLLVGDHSFHPVLCRLAFVEQLSSDSPMRCLYNPNPQSAANLPRHRCRGYQESCQRRRRTSKTTRTGWTSCLPLR